MITLVVIFVMLLFVYRSIATMLILLDGVHRTRRSHGVVAFLGSWDIIGLSTFAVNLLTMLAIAAGTDYAIFLVGRYPGGAPSGRGPRSRVLHHVHGTAHVILGSGLTIAGAMLCLTSPAAVFPDHGCAVRDRHCSSRSSPR